MAFLETEFGPCFTFCNARVDALFHDGGADPACGLYFLAVIVEAVCGDGLGAIFVCLHLLGGK